MVPRCGVGAVLDVEVTGSTDAEVERDTTAGRTVLTTGANSGVGLATVVHLARLGFHSVGSVRSPAEAAIAAASAESDPVGGASQPSLTGRETRLTFQVERAENRR